MEKTIRIDGKNINFKCTAGTLRRYRNQFGREFFADLAKFMELENGNFDNFTFAPLEDIIWVMAKTADDTIPEPDVWYDGFDDFPLVDVFTSLEDLLLQTLKRKNSSAAVHPAAKRKRKKKRH